MSDQHRLKTLYSISKKLSVFTTVNESFAEILECAAESFPLSSAVLIEHWEQEPRTAIWFSKNTPKEVVARAIENANSAYSFLSGTISGDTATPENELLTNDRTLLFNKNDSGNYIVIPLVIDHLPPLGALQLEGTAALNEQDLEFVIALANLVSVALDRYYKTKRERLGQEDEAKKSLKKLFHSQDKIQNLESERDLREAFVSLLTHDLRTPLSVVLGSAQMILRKPNDLEANLKSARMIITNVHRAGQMITDLLDANRIRSGEGLQVRKEKTNLTELIKSTLSELTVIYGNRFVFQESSKIECSVDPKGLRRIIENLSNNAIKYGSSTAPVTVALKQTPEAIVISVSNEGNVISPEDQKSLFHQFRRTASAKDSPNKGWGIGLTLVKGVTEAHGGSVSVSSDQTKGTVFSITLPK